MSFERDGFLLGRGEENIFDDHKQTGEENNSVYINMEINAVNFPNGAGVHVREIIALLNLDPKRRKGNF